MEWLEFFLDYPWLILLVVVVAVLVYIYFRGPSNRTVQDEVDDLLDWTRRSDND